MIFGLNILPFQFRQIKEIILVVRLKSCTNNFHFLELDIVCLLPIYKIYRLSYDFNL